MRKNKTHFQVASIQSSCPFKYENCVDARSSFFYAQTSTNFVLLGTMISEVRILQMGQDVTWPSSRVLEEEEKAGCFAIIDLQLYCYCKCSVALPHDAVGCSAVCDCGIY